MQQHLKYCLEAKIVITKKHCVGSYIIFDGKIKEFKNLAFCVKHLL